jgi:hypothetical protein
MQMAAHKSPSDAAREVFDAFKSGEWDRLAGLFDPAEQVRVRDQQLAILTAWAQYRPDKNRSASGGITGFTSEETPDPAMLQRHADTPIRSFRGSPTLGKVAAMSPQTFMIEWLTASYGGPEAKGALGFGGMSWGHRDILGTVTEGESLAQVVYRVDAAEWRHPWRVSVLSLRRAPDGRWLALFDDLWHGPGMMRSFFEPPEGSPGEP